MIIDVNEKKLLRYYLMGKQTCKVTYNDSSNDAFKEPQSKSKIILMR